MTQTATAIEVLKKQLGSSLCIAGHHYQHDAVIRHCDIIGDSLELARRVAAIDAQHIVFCGVHFMAESAALLARAGQQVHLPAEDAHCVMAQMTPASLVRAVLVRLHAAGKKVVPLAYVNTPVAVKAVVGEFGGAVCTSANATAMLRWAFEQGDGVLFLPDANLGRNTARALGLNEAACMTLNIRKQGEAFPLAEALQKQLLLWPGCCAVHAKIHAEHIAALRLAHPQAHIVVHPECAPDVVAAADGAGSTTYLINAVRQAPQGSTIAVGTECSLVDRLCHEYAQQCTVLPVRRIQCSDMAKCTEEKLLTTLQQVQNNTAPCITVPKAQQQSAKVALERMLDVCARAGE
jgi:quinolinate synthase